FRSTKKTLLIGVAFELSSRALCARSALGTLDLAVHVQQVREVGFQLAPVVAFRPDLAAGSRRDLAVGFPPGPVVGSRQDQAVGSQRAPVVAFQTVQILGGASQLNATLARMGPTMTATTSKPTFPRWTGPIPVPGAWIPPLRPRRQGFSAFWAGESTV